ncbi:MAG: DUF5688 family protein [Lachnospiraceae bacterium]|nr:DUF5688 family protein [Lachnospiraceae bacterium]
MRFSSLAAFKEQLKADLTKVLSAHGYDVKLSEHSVQKVNGVFEGISVTDQRYPSVGVAVYPEALYPESEDRGYDAVLDCTVETVKESLNRAEEVGKIAEQLCNYEYVKNRLFLSIVNTDKNVELLKNVPHFEICDLSVVYRIKVETDNVLPGGIGSVVVRTDMLNKWGVSEQELKADALRSTGVVNPAQISDMADIIPEMLRNQFGHNIPEELIGDIPKDVMFVATTESSLFGAAAIAYPGNLEKIAGYVNDSFWVIPSSIHECIILPDRAGIDPEFAGSLVPRVNAECVKPNEVLSESLYHYHWEHGLLEIKEDYLARIGKGVVAYA